MIKIATCDECGFTGKYIKMYFHKKPGRNKNGKCYCCSCYDKLFTKPKKQTLSKSEKYKLAKQRRKEREENAEGSFSKEEFIKKALKRGCICHYCKKEFPLKKLQPEHLIPLCRGGSNDISNIEPSCWECNRKKGRRTEKEYLKSLQNRRP